MIPEIDLCAGERPRGLRLELLAEPVELLGKAGVQLGIERLPIRVDEGLYGGAAAGKDRLLQGQALTCKGPSTCRVPPVQCCLYL